MKIIPQTHAMPPPEDWPENKVECGIHGKVIYQWKISEAECESYWLTIVRDKNYKYYNIVTATPKDFYQKFHDSPNGKAVSVTHEACPVSSKMLLNNESSYYFTIRKYYIHYDFAIETDTGSTDAWGKLPVCSWNLIDEAPINSLGVGYLKSEERFTQKIDDSVSSVCRLHGMIHDIHFNFKNETIQEGGVILQVKNENGEFFSVGGKGIRYPLYVGDPFFEEGKTKKGDNFDFIIDPQTQKIMDFSFKVGAISECKKEDFSLNKIQSLQGTTNVQNEISYIHLALLFIFGLLVCISLYKIVFYFKKSKRKK